MIIAVRASSLDRLLTCHGSRILSAKAEAGVVDVFGDGPADGHAVQWAGSWCHNHAAVRLRDEYGAIGTPDPLTIPAAFKASTYDEWVSDWYVEQVMKIIPSDWALFIEREVVRDFILPVPVFGITTVRLTGHLDLTAVSPSGEDAIICDLKRGYDPVDAADSNWQLAGYTALLNGEMPKLKRVLLRILQPTVPDRITEVTVHNPSDVGALIHAELTALIQDPYTFVTGKGCKYCPGLTICPVAIKDILLMKETLTKEFIDALPDTASTQELAELAYHAKKLEYPTKRLIEAFKARLEQVGTVTLASGVVAEIIEEDGPRKITDPFFAHQLLAEKVGQSAAWGTLKMGVTAAEQSLVDSGMQKNSKKKEVMTASKWVDANLGITRTKQKTLAFGPHKKPQSKYPNEK